MIRTKKILKRNYLNIFNRPTDTFFMNSFIDYQVVM